MNEAGAGVRNLFKYCKAYCGHDPQLIEQDIFKFILRLPPRLPLKLPGKLPGKLNGHQKFWNFAELKNLPLRLWISLG
jgi:ATP-dependent DNA helicase RecG